MHARAHECMPGLEDAMIISAVKWRPAVLMFIKLLIIQIESKLHRALSMLECRRSFRLRGRWVHEWRRLWRPRTNRQTRAPKGETPQCFRASARTVRERQRTKTEATQHAVVRRVVRNTNGNVGWLEEFDRYDARDHCPGSFGVFSVIFWEFCGTGLTNRLSNHNEPVCGKTARRDGLSRFSHFWHPTFQ